MIFILKLSSSCWRIWRCRAIPSLRLVLSFSPIILKGSRRDWPIIEGGFGCSFGFSGIFTGFSRVGFGSLMLIFLVLKTISA